MNSKPKAAIIGAGPAGTAAAIQLKRQGVAFALFDETGAAGGLVKNADSIENLPPLEIGTDGKTFVEILQKRLDAYRIPVTPLRIDEIETENGLFALKADGETLEGFKAVLIAVGTKPNKLELPGALELENKKLFYEIARLKRVLAPRRAAIIGSGDAAFDYALNLARSPETEISIFMRGEKPKALPLLIERVQANPKITIVSNAELTALEQDEGDKIELTFKRGEKFQKTASDCLLAAIGRAPDTRLFSKFMLYQGDINSFLVNLYGGTKISGLYLAGDVLSPKFRQAAISLGGGVAAAMAIAEYLEEA